MGDYQKIRTETTFEGQVLTITLNAPKTNILDRKMMSEIIEVVQGEGGRPSVKAIVFEGAGDHFSFGASVEEHTKELASKMLKTFSHLFRTLIEVNKPMVALVRGQCLGGGMELASFCHWIFASEGAKFGQPEIQLGVFPPVASWILPYKIGQAAADDLVLTGRTITAQEGRGLGLVYDVSSDPTVTLRTFLEKQIMPKSLVGLQFSERVSRFEMYEAFFRNIEKLEHMYVHELMETFDANEGIQSFLEKRKPNWKNK